MSEIFLHIGYPKCLSTTLQRCIFSKHPQILYGGIGSPDIISYQNDSIELFFESILKYANDTFYQNFKKQHQSNIDEFILSSEGKRIVFSSEHLSMNFTLQGIDSKVKYTRIKEVFDKHSVNFLIVKREPRSILRSLYGEFVRMGYYGTYKDFLSWILMTHDRNFLFDLNYNNKEKQLREVFGDVNIKWLDFEEITKTGVRIALNHEISGWLNIENIDLETPNENPGLTLDEIEILRSINEKERRGIGLSQTEPFERHRSKVMFKHSPLDMAEDEVFSNVIDRRRAIQKIDMLKNKSSKDIYAESENLEKKVIEYINNNNIV